MVSRSQPTTQPLSHYIQPILFCLNYSHFANPFRHGGKYPLFHTFLSNLIPRFSPYNYQKQPIFLHRIAHRSIRSFYRSHALRHLSHCDDPIQNPHHIPCVCLSCSYSHWCSPRHPQYYLSQNHFSTFRIFFSREKRRHHQSYDQRCHRGRSLNHCLSRNYIQKSYNDHHLSRCAILNELETNNFRSHPPPYQRTSNRSHRQISQTQISPRTTTLWRTHCSNRRDSRRATHHQSLQCRRQTRSTIRLAQQLYPPHFQSHTHSLFPCTPR